MIRYGITLSVVLVLATACGGGGGGGSTTNLTGWWETQARLTGGGSLLQPVAKVQLDQVGNTVWMNGTGLTLAGASLTGADPNYTAAERVEMNMFVSSPNLIE